MKNYDDIIDRFNDIQELSVSEEMLGAYIEGNLNSYEMEQISESIQDDELLRAISEDIISTPFESDNNNLLDIEMHNENSSLINDETYSPDSMDSNIIEQDDLMDHSSYIEESHYTNENESFEDYDVINGNDSYDDTNFDVSSFELPEIPFF